MGQSCITIKITSQEIDLTDSYKEQKQTKEQQFVSSEIISESDSQESSNKSIITNQSNDQQWEKNEISQLNSKDESPKQLIKSILKRISSCENKSNNKKTVHFCQNQAKTIELMKNYKGKLSRAQQNLLDSLSSSL